MKIPSMRIPNDMRIGCLCLEGEHRLAGWYLYSGKGHKRSLMPVIVCETQQDDELFVGAMDFFAEQTLKDDYDADKFDDDDQYFGHVVYAAMGEIHGLEWDQIVQGELVIQLNQRQMRALQSYGVIFDCGLARTAALFKSYKASPDDLYWKYLDSNDDRVPASKSEMLLGCLPPGSVVDVKLSTSDQLDLKGVPEPAKRELTEEEAWQAFWSAVAKGEGGNLMNGETEDGETMHVMRGVTLRLPSMEAVEQSRDDRLEDQADQQELEDMTPEQKYATNEVFGATNHGLHLRDDIKVIERKPYARAANMLPRPRSKR